MTPDELKAKAIAAIDAQAVDLIDLSHRIHANPELAFKEAQACDWLTETLASQGYQVEKGLGSLDTAFRATAGSGPPVVAVLAEYDALPGIGHGCGHNIIATTAVGAAAGLIAVAGETGGTVHIIGTPAEEVYGGKVIMIREGAFHGVDAALMTHPGSRDAVDVKALALVELEVEYHGRESHAAASPELGINALDAMLIAFNAISALRQHIRSTARIHGVITHGGDAPNIVPGHTAAGFLVRAEDDAYLADLRERVTGCFQAGADATGATLTLRWNPNEYGALHTNAPIAEAHRKNLAAIGRVVPENDPPRPLGSTDMGNVSSVVPAIHPMIKVAPPDTSAHTVEFERHAKSPAGDAAAIDGAKALAMTAIDILTDADLRDRMRAYFEAMPR